MAFRRQLTTAATAALLSCVLFRLQTSSAFMVPASPATTTTTTGHNAVVSSRQGHFNARVAPLFGSKDRYDDGDREYHDALALNRARTDIRNFLTQRALQSFIFLLRNCRDQPTVHWMEKTYDFKNLHRFHGTGAFNLTKYPTWDCILNDMLGRDSDVVIVTVKARANGANANRPASQRNPYLEDKSIDFEIDIDPPKLVYRILSVREQISKEWSKDLEALIDINEMLLEAYETQQNVDRSEDGPSSSNKNDDDDDDDDDDDMDVAGMDKSSTDSLTTPYSAPAPKEGKKVAFDRSQMMYLGNLIGSDSVGDSSPVRKGSFDLLKLLATQESIHRVLREYREAGEERDVSFEWLREFYTSRTEKFFDGNQEYHRADDFMEELLLTSPSMKELEGGKKVGLIDPLRIAEDIIEMRSEVYSDWKEIVDNVPTKDHADIRRRSLQITLGKSQQETAFTESPSEETTEEVVIVEESKSKSTTSSESKAIIEEQKKKEEEEVYVGGTILLEEGAFQ